MLTEKMTTRPPPEAAVYWLITRGRDGRSEALTIGSGGEKALPVFSFREEAEMFLSSGTLGEGWGFRRATADELVSILVGPCVGVGSVALDPMPENAFRGMLRLVSLSRERFLARLVEKVRLENAAPASEPGTKRKRTMRKLRGTKAMHMSAGAMDPSRIGETTIEDKAEDWRTGGTY